MKELELISLIQNVGLPVALLIGGAVMMYRYFSGQLKNRDKKIDELQNKVSELNARLLEQQASFNAKIEEMHKSIFLDAQAQILALLEKLTHP